MSEPVLHVGRQALVLQLRVRSIGCVKRLAAQIGPGFFQPRRWRRAVYGGARQPLAIANPNPGWRPGAGRPGYKTIPDTDRKRSWRARCRVNLRAAELRRVAGSSPGRRSRTCLLCRSTPCAYAASGWFPLRRSLRCERDKSRRRSRRVRARPGSQRCSRGSQTRRGGRRPRWKRYPVRRVAA